MKRILKKSLSLILSLAVVLSCMVFALPQASAADGDYDVRLTIKVTGTNNFKAEYGGFAAKKGDTVGVSVGYTSKNGTGSVSYKDWDLGNGSKGNSYIKTKNT